MKSEEIILFFIIIPALIFIATFLFLKSKKFSNTSNHNYSITFFTKRIIISKHELIVLFVLLLCFSWLNVFLPFALSLLLISIILFSFPIASFKIYNSHSNKETTQILLDKLTVIENEIESTKEHFGVLQTDLNQAQLEVDKKQKIKEELDAQILENKASAETWASMTEKQKSLVSQTAVNAISNKLKGDFRKGLIWGFVINILTTLIWTLLDNPGKKDLLEKFNSFVESINRLI